MGGDGKAQTQPSELYPINNQMYLENIEDKRGMNHDAAAVRNPIRTAMVKRGNRHGRMSERDGFSGAGEKFGDNGNFERIDRSKQQLGLGFCFQYVIKFCQTRPFNLPDYPVNPNISHSLLRLALYNRLNSTRSPSHSIITLHF
ncbi:hypothetical protein PRUPE_6G125900 [Prunus persica]|uniref:Uncharacterized protein n=1 Tax=Prunus persica TaxID=3760 RepID=A0A251NR12_PRUPE|nr:hypothetical protein PRUPE_6G125900 [Prunus persica]